MPGFPKPQDRPVTLQRKREAGGESRESALGTRDSAKERTAAVRETPNAASVRQVSETTGETPAADGTSGTAEGARPARRRRGRRGGRRGRGRGEGGGSPNAENTGMTSADPVDAGGDDDEGEEE
jgi:hypothetical protein